MSIADHPTVTTTPPVPDPVAAMQAAYDQHAELGDLLVTARRDLAAITFDGDYVAHWTAVGAAETRIADLYQRRADLDPADTESAACAQHYRTRAATSSGYRADSQAVTA